MQDYLNLKMNLIKMVQGILYIVRQKAEVYGKWQFTSSQNVLAGVTHQNIDGDVLSYGSPYDEDVNSTGYFVQHQYQNNGLNTQVGVRVEDNEKYGTHTVAQGAIRYQLYH